MIRRRPTSLPQWHEWAIYALVASLVVTGVAWLVLDNWVRIEGEFGPEHHPAEHMMMIVHGIIAYAFLAIAGALIPVHVVMGWRTRRNLVSGFILAGLCLFLALSALALYYVGNEAGRSAASLSHWLVGLILIPAFMIHAIRGRRGA